MLEVSRGAANLDDGHDGSDPGAAADTHDRPLLLRRKNSAAERAEPFDRIASAGLREQPLCERAIGFALHREGRLLHSPRMIDHRITAETGDMRRPHHNELPGVELERGIELDQKLDHVRRESVKAPHSASTERWSNPSGGSQIHAAKYRSSNHSAHRVWTRAAPRLDRGEGRLCPATPPSRPPRRQQGALPCTFRRYPFHIRKNRHACPQRGIEQWLLRLGVEAAGGNLGPRFDQHRPLRRPAAEARR